MSQKSYYCTESSQPQLQKEQTLSNNPLRTPIKQTFLQSSTQYVTQDQTIQKINQPRTQIFQNSTPRPQRKIILYDQNNQRHFFPLYREKDLNIPREYREMLIESWNDDDKKTSSTQLKRGMDQTMNDLYEAFGYEEGRESQRE